MLRLRKTAANDTLQMTFFPLVIVALINSRAFEGLKKTVGLMKRKKGFAL